MSNNDAEITGPSLEAVLNRVNRAAQSLHKLNAGVGRAERQRTEMARLFRKMDTHVGAIRRGLSPLQNLSGFDPERLEALARPWGAVVASLEDLAGVIGSWSGDGSPQQAYEVFLDFKDYRDQLGAFLGKLDLGAGARILSQRAIDPLADQMERATTAYNQFLDLLKTGHVDKDTRDKILVQVAEFEHAVDAYNRAAEQSAEDAGVPYRVMGDHVRHINDFAWEIHNLVGGVMTDSVNRGLKQVAPKSLGEGAELGRGVGGAISALDQGDLVGAFQQLKGTLPGVFRGTVQGMREVARLITSSKRSPADVEAMDFNKGVLGFILQLLVTLYNRADKAGKGLNKGIIKTFGAKSMGMPLGSLRGLVTEMAGVGQFHLRPEEVLETASALFSAGYNMNRLAKDGKDTFKHLADSVRMLTTGIGIPIDQAGELVASMSAGFGSSADQVQDTVSGLMIASINSRMDAKSFFDTYKNLYASFDGYLDRGVEAEGMIGALGRNAHMTGPAVQAFFDDLTHVNQDPESDQSQMLFRAAYAAGSARTMAILRDELQAYRKQAPNSEMARYQGEQLELILNAFQDGASVAELGQAMAFVGPAAVVRLQLLALEKAYGEVVTPAMLRRRKAEMGAGVAAKIIGVTGGVTAVNRYLDGLAALIEDGDLTPEGIEAKVKKERAKHAQAKAETLRKLRLDADSLAQLVGGEMELAFQGVYEAIEGVADTLYSLIQTGDYALDGMFGTDYDGPAEDGVGYVPIDPKMADFVRKTAPKADVDEILRAADEAGKAQGMNPNLLLATAYRESSFNKNAVSSAGAVGLAQFMPGTAPGYGVTDRRNIAQSLVGMAKYLKYLLKFQKDLDPSISEAENLIFALSSYNAGEGAVQRLRHKAAGGKGYAKSWRQVLDAGLSPSETERYGERILDTYHEHTSRKPGAGRPGSGRPAPPPVTPFVMTAPKGLSADTAIKAQLNVDHIDDGGAFSNTIYDIVVEKATTRQINAFLAELASRGAAVHGAGQLTAKREIAPTAARPGVSADTRTAD